MATVYLLAYTRELGTFQEVKDCLNALPEVITWRKEIPNTFFIASTATPDKLGEAIRTCMGKENPRFFLTEVTMSDEHTSGWLSAESWAFLANLPKHLR